MLTHPATEPSQGCPRHCFAVRTVLSSEGVGRSVSPTHTLSPREMDTCCSPHLQGCWWEEWCRGRPSDWRRGYRISVPICPHRTPGGAISAWGQLSPGEGFYLTPGSEFPSPCCTAPAVEFGTDVAQRGVALGGRGGSGVFSSPSTNPRGGQSMGEVPAARASSCPIALHRR